VEDTPPPLYGQMTLACKKVKKATFPFVIMYSGGIPANWNVQIPPYDLTQYKGRDFSLSELKAFIKQLKVYAAKVWTTAEKELKNI